jgi:hypothetical protein
MTPSSLKGVLYGGLVLSTNKPPSVPFFSAQFVPTQHIHGAPYGSVYSTSEYSSAYYLPQQGSRRYSVYSVAPLSDGYGELMIKNLVAAQNSSESMGLKKNLRTEFYDSCPDASLFVLEQSVPYGALIFQSKGIELSMYGLYNADEAILFWTNSDLIERHLLSTYGERYLLYRFLPRTNFATVVMTARVCSRWYRWGKTKEFKSQGSRFPILERSLFYEQPTS